MIEDFELYEDGPEDGPDTPDFRAAIDGDRMTLLRWFDQVPVIGPVRQVVVTRDTAGVNLADLRVSGDLPVRVVVCFHADGERRRSPDSPRSGGDGRSVSPALDTRGYA